MTKLPQKTSYREQGGHWTVYGYKKTLKVPRDTTISLIHEFKMCSTRNPLRVLGGGKYTLSSRGTNIWSELLRKPLNLLPKTCKMTRWIEETACECRVIGRKLGIFWPRIVHWDRKSLFNWYLKHPFTIVVPPFKFSFTEVAHRILKCILNLNVILKWIEIQLSWFLKGY